MAEFGGVDYTNSSAADIIKAMLAPYGLGELGGQMYNVGKDTGSADAAYLWLRDQPQYKAAFPGMAMRAQNGLAPLNEQQYNDYKSAIKSVMQNNGLPPSFYDHPDDFAKWIGEYDVSPAEVESRVKEGVLAAQQAPQEVKDALFNYYGIDEGHLAAYWLDPNKKGPELMKQQAATYIGAAAAKARFAGLSRQEAEQVSSYGVTGEQATERFGDLSYASELLDALPGEELGKMSREQQLQYVENNPQAQQELKKRAAQRKAQFAGGGGFVEGAGGVAGLASQA